VLLPDLCGGLVIEPLDEPGGVVDVAEGEQREPEFFDGVEGLDPQQVLLERSDEALCAAISLRRTDECWRALNAQEAHLGLEGVGHVLRAMIVANRKAAGDILADGVNSLAILALAHFRCRWRLYLGSESLREMTH
jgi:hypothetical protein